MGWFLPALIVGKILVKAFDNQQSPAVGNPQPVPPPQPQPQPRPVTAPLNSTPRCANCGGAVTPQYAFCPHCGRRLEPPACRYCGQTLDAKASHCTHCGAPRSAPVVAGR